jgi:hypothetical protein
MCMMTFNVLGHIVSETLGYSKAVRSSEVEVRWDMWQCRTRSRREGSVYEP